MTEQELKQKMGGLVNDWWRSLTDGQKNAVKLLKFSPAVIGSMFFFNNDTANGFVIDDYKDILQIIAESGIDRKDWSYGIFWETYHANEQICRDIEKGIANNELIRKLPDNLKNQVVDNLRRQDVTWNERRLMNIEELRNARKDMFWNAIKELRKTVEG